jgi:SatD family (SatD)
MKTKLAPMTHKSPPTMVAIVGDVIASRDSRDREALQENMVTAMEVLNEEIPAVQPLTMTVGDEFQGLYENLERAFFASLRLRLELANAADVRIGIGWGELTLAPVNPPFGQDGPCWWRAREAINEVKKGESSNSVPNSLRTLCRTGTRMDDLINGYLGLRDHVVSGFDDIDVRLSLLRLAGSTQAEMASVVGLSQSSVSRRFQSHGLFTVIDGQPEHVAMSG